MFIVSQRGGLDFEVVEVTEEVQKERENVSDWTLKRWEGKQKSKRDKSACRIGR